MKQIMLAGVSLLALSVASSGADAAAITYSGAIAHWTAPTTGTYDIVAYGAQGGPGGNPNAVGGLGAEMGGYFRLTAGTVLSIVVGGQGGISGGTGSGGSGGGFSGQRSGGRHFTETAIRGEDCGPMGDPDCGGFVPGRRRRRRIAAGAASGLGGSDGGVASGVTPAAHAGAIRLLLTRPGKRGSRAAQVTKTISRR